MQLYESWISAGRSAPCSSQILVYLVAVMDKILHQSLYNTVYLLQSIGLKSETKAGRIPREK